MHNCHCSSYSLYCACASRGHALNYCVVIIVLKNEARTNTPTYDRWTTEVTIFPLQLASSVVDKHSIFKLETVS